MTSDSKLTKEERRTAGRNLYVYGYKSIAEIAIELDVSETSVRKWRSAALVLGDDWDKARSASRLAAGGLNNLTAQVLEEFTVRFSGVMEKLKEFDDNPLEAAEAMAKISSAYVKLSSAIERTTPQLNELAVAQKVLTLFKSFIQTHYPQHLGIFAEILEPFSVQLSKKLQDKK